jgi:hypothetical protein
MNTNNSDEIAALLVSLGVSEDKLVIADDGLDAGKVPDEFKMLAVEKFGVDTILTATFYFSRIESESLSYVLRKYDAQLTFKDKSVPPRKQTFFLIKSVIITLKEAFNLLQGRSVYKEFSTSTGEKYHAWVSLNLAKKDIHGNYEFEYTRLFQAFDLGRALANYPIQELLEEKSALRLIQSLLMGNKELINFIRGKRVEKVYIEANCQMETVTISPAVRPRKSARNAEAKPHRELLFRSLSIATDCH